MKQTIKLKETTDDFNLQGRSYRVLKFIKNFREFRTQMSYNWSGKEELLT